jgi:threonine synthase
MGEGGTELLKNVRISGIANMPKLHIKVETENPTKTFKDRGSSVEITKAKELGFGAVCCASTGNMGFSLARYAKKEGIRCTVFISSSANKEKMEKIKREGAEIKKINGDFNDSLTAAENFARKNGTFICGDYHYRKEGQKSLVFEIIEQMKYRTPDYIIVQVGNSTLLAAVFKGLGEFIRLGLIKRMPKLIAVQSRECDPLVRAFNNKRKVAYVKPRTKADAIAVGYPTFGFEGLNALKETGGFAESASDSEIEKAGALLYESTGIKAELGGAAGFAGFLKIHKSKPKLFRNKEIVLIITGNNED